MPVTESMESLDVNPPPHREPSQLLQSSSDLLGGHLPTSAPRELKGYEEEQQAQFPATEMIPSRFPTSPDKIHLLFSAQHSDFEHTASEETTLVLELYPTWPSSPSNLPGIATLVLSVLSPFDSTQLLPTLTSSQPTDIRPLLVPAQDRLLCSKFKHSTSSEVMQSLWALFVHYW